MKAAGITPEQSPSGRSLALSSVEVERTFSLTPQNYDTHTPRLTDAKTPPAYCAKDEHAACPGAQIRPQRSCRTMTSWPRNGSFHRVGVLFVFALPLQPTGQYGVALDTQVDL